MKKFFVKRLHKLLGITHLIEKLVKEIIMIRNLRRNLEKEIKEVKQIKSQLYNDHQEFRESLKMIDEFKKLNNVLKEGRIGADMAFGPHSRSWAIVCLGKHPDAVYFYQFPDGSYAKDLNDFLKRFNRTIDRDNIMIDCPYGTEKLFHF